MPEYDLVCIGCGPAGEQAAVQAGSLGRQVAVVEREARPGGAMVNTGTVASKALRETALLCSALRRRPLPGIEPPVNRSLSIHKLMTQRYRVQYQEHDRIESALERQRVEVYHGHGRMTDRNTVCVEAAGGAETLLRTRYILIATGSSPVRPDHIPFSHRSVVDADGILELARVPGSVIVAGGGVVGCEYACMLAELGVTVTLIDPRDQLLAFIDGECRDHLVRSMLDGGIEIRLNTSVRAVAPQEDDTVTVHLDNGEFASCDVLLWAAGRRSNTENLGLDSIGVRTGQRGLLLVNEHYQTSVPNIYAAGDVVGFPALSSTAMEQGCIAARHMFGIDVDPTLADRRPFGLYTIPAVSTVGLTEKQAAEAGHDVVVGRALYRHNARGRMLGDEQGLVKCVFDAGSRRLLGATIVGEDACELIHLAQFILAFEGGLDDIVQACFNYPSLAELYRSAACDALGVIGARAHHREAA